MKFKCFLQVCVVIMIIISITSIFTIVKVNAQKEERALALINKIIYLDAGHGGKDNGASIDNVMEDYINLKITKYIYELLINDGVYVLMSRTDDYDLASMYQKNRKKEDLNKRMKYINDSKPNIFISIHLNTYPLKSVRGAQVFFQENPESQKLAKSLQDELNKGALKERKTKKGDYYILNNTLPIGVIVECGFLSNDEERILLNQEKYQKKIASKIHMGIVKYFHS